MPSIATQATEAHRGLFTGHVDFRKHLSRIGATNTGTICKSWGDEEVTASYLIFQCEALERKRYRTLGSTDQADILTREIPLVGGGGGGY